MPNLVQPSPKNSEIIAEIIYLEIEQFIRRVNLGASLSEKTVRAEYGIRAFPTSAAKCILRGSIILI